MYDIFSNNKICKVRDYAEQSVGAAYQPSETGIDLQEIAENGLCERTTRGLLLVEVGAVGAGGTLTLVFQDLAERTETVWDADFCTLEAISTTGDYSFDVDGIKNKFRLLATVGVAAISWGAQFIGFNAQRRPVKQTDFEELTGTYATGR